MSEKQNKSILAEKLSGLKLDYEAYGHMPMRLEVLAIVPPKDKAPDGLVKQYDKITYIKQHLQKVNDYIKSGTKKPINIWDAETKAGLSTRVLSELKGHNNETGGISMYFYNLQNLYDIEEALYDKMESECELPADSKKQILALRAERLEKRKTRSAERKILVKDLKKDGKGYLYVEVEKEPEAVEKEKKKKEEEERLAADGAIKEEVKKETEKIKKTTSKVGVYVAGTVIFVTLVAAVWAASKEES